MPVSDAKGKLGNWRFLFNVLLIDCTFDFRFYDQILKERLIINIFK